MWYRYASGSQKWEKLADDLAEHTRSAMEERLKGRVLPSGTAKLADELRQMFLKTAGEGRDLRSMPATAPEAYSNLRYQLDLYATLTYRDIISSADTKLAEAVDEDAVRTAQNKAEAIATVADDIRKATLQMVKYIEHGPKFKRLEKDYSPHEFWRADGRDKNQTRMYDSC